MNNYERYYRRAYNALQKLIKAYKDGYNPKKMSEFRESLRLAAKFPMMYRAVDAEEICDVRVFHCEYISVYYRILETEILVETVFDTRQDPAKLPY